MNKTTAHRSTKRLHLSLIAALLVAALGVLFVLVAYADPNGTGTIIIKKQTHPAGGTGFEFTDDIPGGPAIFYLDDGEQRQFLNVPNDTYTITETNPAVIPGGWILTSIECVDEKGITWEVKQVATTTVVISTTRQTVECIFTNERPPVVGGYVIPVNKLGLLAPWLGLLALASFAALTVVLIRRLISD
jgi:hypothetical protein